ncbi:ATP synthase d subunit [Naganishia albida]|nr:ATP synthase d subunit [Naganishia albida]
MAAKNAVSKVDWTKITSGLGLGKETLSELGAFRARHAAAATKNASLKATVPEIDLARYKSILRDQRAVEQAQKVLSEFKPATYDLAKFTSAIDAFEGRAVEAAKATVEKISSEEKDLQSTLSNIQDARPFEDLTITEIAKAQPQITQAVETMIQKGKWSVPGYREKFGEQSLM